MHFELLVVVASDSEQTGKPPALDVGASPDPVAVGGDRCQRGRQRPGTSALDFARGAFVLMLAPGQELYPRCLDVLTGALEEMPEVAFAYPMQEVTGAPDDFVQHRRGLSLSFTRLEPRASPRSATTSMLRR